MRGAPANATFGFAAFSVVDLDQMMRLSLARASPNAQTPLVIVYFVLLSALADFIYTQGNGSAYARDVPRNPHPPDHYDVCTKGFYKA